MSLKVPVPDGPGPARRILGSASIPDPGIIWGVKDVATYLNVSDRIARKLLQDKKIDGWQIQAGGKPKVWRTTKHRVIQYVEGEFAEHREKLFEIIALVESHCLHCPHASEQLKSVIKKKRH